LGKKRKNEVLLQAQENCTISDFFAASPAPGGALPKRNIAALAGGAERRAKRHLADSGLGRILEP
jgi:hypothetical protein